jgi:hypothetical protein
MLNGLCALAASSLLPYGRRIDPVNRPFEPAGKALKLAKPAAPDSPCLKSFRPLLALQKIVRQHWGVESAT